MKFRLWWLGAIAVVGLALYWRNSKSVAPGTVFGSVPGTNLPGLFVVNTTRNAPNDASATTTAPPGLFDPSADRQAGSR